MSPINERLANSVSSAEERSGYLATLLKYVCIPLSASSSCACFFALTISFLTFSWLALLPSLGLPKVNQVKAVKDSEHHAFPSLCFILLGE